MQRENRISWRTETLKEIDEHMQKEVDEFLEKYKEAASFKEKMKLFASIGKNRELSVAVYPHISKDFLKGLTENSYFDEKLGKPVFKKEFLDQ